MLKTAIALILLVLAGFLAYVRLAPSDPLVWHVDPLEARKPWRKRNVFILRAGEPKAPPPPVYDTDARSLARAFDAFATAQDRVRRLAGDPDDLFVTYVARSRLIGYPDYISVRFLPLEGGRSTLAILARARFGNSDLGVNRNRIETWLAAFDPA